MSCGIWRLVIEVWSSEFAILNFAENLGLGVLGLVLQVWSLGVGFLEIGNSDLGFSLGIWRLVFGVFGFWSLRIRDWGFGYGIWSS